MRKSKTLDRNYFEGLYQKDVDPWKFATSPYESAKYERTIEALAGERSRRGLEVGCSIGVLTEKLAEHCDELVATDISATALQQARARCAALETIHFRLVSSAGSSFDSPFDLIVLSEVVYYWDDADLDVVADALKRVLSRGGRILMVHWLGETDYPKSADDALKGLAKRLRGTYSVERTDRAEEYRLDLWRWNGGA